MPRQVDIATAESVRESLLTARYSAASIVVADLTSTDYCDSTGFRTLAEVHRALAARGKELRLALTASGAVARTLMLLELDQMLPAYRTVDAALSASE
jgi:anti-anti-sigma factor